MVFTNHEPFFAESAVISRVSLIAFKCLGSFASRPRPPPNQPAYPRVPGNPDEMEIKEDGMIQPPDTDYKGMKFS